MSFFSGMYYSDVWRLDKATWVRFPYNQRMTPDYNTATICLRENLERLDGSTVPEQKALWNISNSLLVVLDALRGLEARLSGLERKQ
jgi:hypothetical protein